MKSLQTTVIVSKAMGSNKIKLNLCAAQKSIMSFICSWMKPVSWEDNKHFGSFVFPICFSFSPVLTNSLIVIILGVANSLQRLSFSVSSEKHWSLFQEAVQLLAEFVWACVYILSRPICGKPKEFTNSPSFCRIQGADSIFPVSVFRGAFRLS